MSNESVQHKTIESVLERGEKLDNLVERSNALSAQSKMFYKTAKKVCLPDVRLPDTPLDAHDAAKLVLRDHVIGRLYVEAISLGGQALLVGIFTLVGLA